jgi:hypothetical protein
MDAISTAAPLGIRNNNPWSLQQCHVPWLGLVPAIEPSTGGLIFDTLEDGIRAGIKLCYTYQSEGLSVPALFIPKYSPAAAGNPTAEYLENVCAWTGFAPNIALDFHDIPTMVAWAQAIFRQEQGVGNGITDTEIQQAIALANAP